MRDIFCSSVSQLAALGGIVAAQTSSQALVLMYRQIPGLADELCEIKAHGRHAEALNRLGELREMREALLRQLALLF